MNENKLQHAAAVDGGGIFMVVLEEWSPCPRDAQGSQGLPHRVAGWWHRVGWQIVSASKYPEKKWENPTLPLWALL